MWFTPARLRARIRLVKMLAILTALTLGTHACDNAPSEPATITLSGAVGEFIPAGGFVALEGAAVCVHESDEIPCATSDAEGRYTLSGVPGGSEVLLSFTHEDYVGQLGMLSTESEDIGPVEIRLARVAAAEVFFSMIGADYPLGETGGITFGAYPTSTGGGLTADAGISGYSVTITPPSGSGPVFVNDSEFPDLALTQTAAPGWGLFANVEPGMVDVSFVKASGLCPTVRPGYGWDSALDGSGTVRVPVVPGFLTAVGLLCTE